MRTSGPYKIMVAENFIAKKLDYSLMSHCPHTADILVSSSSEY